MPGGHKYYACPHKRCGKPLLKYRYDEHVKNCKRKFGRDSVGYKKEGRLTMTWRCGAPKCFETFRTEKACDKHVASCKRFEEPWEEKLPKIHGYPGEPGDEINGDISFKEEIEVLYVPVLYEHYQHLEKSSQQIQNVLRWN